MHYCRHWYGKINGGSWGIGKLDMTGNPIALEPKDVDEACGLLNGKTNVRSLPMLGDAATMAFGKCYIEVDGKLTDIRDLTREQYTKFMALMENTNRICAAWWCDLNRWVIPSNFPYYPGFANDEERRIFIKGAFAVVDAIAGKQGLALWKTNHKPKRRAGIAPNVPRKHATAKNDVLNQQAVE